MDTEKRYVTIPIERQKDGSYSGILSDDSIDRDNEFMSPDLIKKWGSGGAIPFLADHENAMDSMLGAWTDRKVIEKDNHTALIMKPNFFSDEANPRAKQVQAQIREAEKMGLGVGVSIGFIPQKGMVVGDKYMHTDAELVEASVVPVQSNRGAYASVAKRFGVKVKKETEVIGAGVHMEGDVKFLETEEGKAIDARIKAIEEAHAKHIAEAHKAPTEEEAKATEEAKAAADKALKDAAEKQAKLEKDLSEHKKKLEDMQGTLNKGKALVPASLLVQALAGKGEAKEKPFNATDAYLKQKGLAVEE